MSTQWANKTLSDARESFSLVYTSQSAGYQSILEVEKQGYEVLNKDEWVHTLTVDRSSGT